MTTKNPTADICVTGPNINSEFMLSLRLTGDQFYEGFSLGSAYAMTAPKRALLEKLVKLYPGTTTPQPNQWCKIVCTKAGDPVLVTRDWDSDEEVEVVRLETRKRFSMTLSLHFDGEDDTVKADGAFAAITGDTIDDILRSRGIDSLSNVLDKDDGE
jgi:hypothetical protein